MMATRIIALKAALDCVAAILYYHQDNWRMFIVFAGFTVADYGTMLLGGAR